MRMASSLLCFKLACANMVGYKSDMELG